MTQGRTLVTVLFADIVGSTAITAARDPEVVPTTLRRSEEQALPPPALRRVRRQQHAIRDHFERVIVEGMRGGEFVESDSKLAALALLGMCTWVHRWYRPRGRLGEAAIADDLAERAFRVLSP